MDKLAFGGGTGSDEKTTEQRIQDEIAGDDVLVSLSPNNHYLASIHDPRRRVYWGTPFHGGSGKRKILTQTVCVVQAGPDF